MYALAADALTLAMASIVERLEASSAGELQLYRSGSKKADIIVEEEHFFRALDALTPSVSIAEMQRYEDVRRKFISD